MNYTNYKKGYKNNVKIRQEVDKNGIYMWQVAREIGVNPTRLSCMMRDEIPEGSALYKDIMSAIEKVSKEHK